MKKFSKMQILAWILSAVPLILVAAVYTRLPTKVPMQWDFGGEIGYEDKWHLWIVAGISPLLAVFMPLMPKLDPKRSNYTKFRSSYDLFQVLMMLFMLLMVSMCVVEGLHPGTLDVVSLVCVFCGLLLTVLGNMMPKFRSNWFCGIRNPWTISSETVWRRTQRVGGRMFFASGLIAMAGAFAPNDYVQFAAIFIPILTSTAILTILSYRWYQQEQHG